MQTIPMDWIDKLFVCMAQFYGDRWTKLIEKPHMADFYKTMWKGGLTGLTYDQIKTQLLWCKKHAEMPGVLLLTVMEFFHHAAQNMAPLPIKPIEEQNLAEKETATFYLTEIKQKLGIRS